MQQPSELCVSPRSASNTSGAEMIWPLFELVNGSVSTVQRSPSLDSETSIDAVDTAVINRSPSDLLDAEDTALVNRLPPELLENCFRRLALSVSSKDSLESPNPSRIHRACGVCL